MRDQMSMDIQLQIQLKHLTFETIADVKRVLHIWKHSMEHNGGPFLFGEHFGITDAFFAPVVMRFKSYGIDVQNTHCQKYMKSILGHGPVQEWVAGAKKEKTVRTRFN